MPLLASSALVTPAATREPAAEVERLPLYQAALLVGGASLSLWAGIFLLGRWMLG